MLGSGPVLGSDPALGSGPALSSGPVVGSGPALGSDPMVGSGQVLCSDPALGSGPALSSGPALGSGPVLGSDPAVFLADSRSGRSPGRTGCDWTAWSGAAWFSFRAGGSICELSRLGPAVSGVGCSAPRHPKGTTGEPLHPDLNNKLTGDFTGLMLI
ncbi:PREDICTED: sperm-associated antigen 8-like isoform X3 [Poecilia mexicana]|uniref:sperm-associated antigen 8-like isoform X2 n=1 Tax=Poecilia mexicana TaxID=48701 RepID=UPI00072EEFCE|nr:PREDICTED: sperm-associated antigen 8-like isoform X2 [Poecilia mexicana]XP_014866458.1 PREDICTED: sperm-associated antigen 8-like isoform X3 [Poecilia mexicana]